ATSRQCPRRLRSFPPATSLSDGDTKEEVRSTGTANPDQLIREPGHGKGHEPSPRLDDCEGSTAVVRGGSPDVGNCEGFRTTADCDRAVGVGAIVRKRPEKEPAAS